MIPFSIRLSTICLYFASSSWIDLYSVIFSLSNSISYSSSAVLISWSWVEATISFVSSYFLFLPLGGFRRKWDLPPTTIVYSFKHVLPDTLFDDLEASENSGNTLTVKDFLLMIIFSLSSIFELISFLNSGPQSVFTITRLHLMVTQIWKPLAVGKPESYILR